MIFIISDLHLSFSTDKPMDIFGDNWTDHTGKIKSDWLQKVSDDDLVVLPGDISWSMRYHEALVDFRWIHELPGTKLIIKGNHDYWWNYKSKLAKEFPSIIFLNSNSYTYGRYTFVGSRGWDIPSPDDAENTKIYNRELVRLENSLKSAPSNRVIIGLTHYPPSPRGQETPVTALFEQYGVEQVYYGHIHTKPAFAKVFKGVLNGVNYSLVSCDYTDFKLLTVADDDNVDIGVDHTDFTESAYLLEKRIQGIKKLENGKATGFDKVRFIEWNYDSLVRFQNSYCYVEEESLSFSAKEVEALAFLPEEAGDFKQYTFLAKDMGQREVLSVADGILKYHFINTLAKKRMLDAEAFEFKDFSRFLEMRKLAYTLYDYKDAITYGLVNCLLEAGRDIRYYKIHMRSEALDGKMYELCALPSERLVLHTMDKTVLDLLKKFGVEELSKQQSIISDYVNKTML